MMKSTRRTSLSPPVTRHFQFTRLEDKLIAYAYHALIPIVSRRLERPRPPRSNSEPSTSTFRDLRSQAEGA
jgi:hypothetical protein